MTRFEKRSLGVCVLLLAVTLLFLLLRQRVAVERPDRVVRPEVATPTSPDRPASERAIKGKNDGGAETAKSAPSSPLPANRDEKADRLCAGRVLDKNSQPIAGATVFLLLIKVNSEWSGFLPLHGHNGSAVDFLRKISLDQRTTAGDGRFQFLLPDADDRSTFAVVAAGPGGALSDEEDCQHGEGIEHTLIISEEKHAILGTVRDENGLPITGATVRVFCDEYLPDCPEMAEMRSWFPSGFCGTETKCDDGGRYRIDWSEGRTGYVSLIEAVAGGFASVRKNIPDRGEIETPPQRIDFIMERGGNISGKVTDEAGNPLRATVRANIDGFNRHVVDCHADGTYQLEGVPETTVEITVECNGCYTETRIIDIASSNTLNFTLRQMPKVTFSGRVIDRESGEPIKDVQINWRKVPATWEHQNFLLNGVYTRGDAETSDDGTFLFTCPVKEGEITLYTQHEDYITLDKAVVLNGRSEVTGIVFDLEKKTTIVVETTDGETGSGIDAEVMATGQGKRYQPSHKWRRMESPTTYGADFDIPPGEYLVRAEAEGYAPAERRIAVAKGQRENVLLKLQREEGAIIQPVNPEPPPSVPILPPEESVDLSGEVTVNGIPFTGTILFSQNLGFIPFDIGPAVEIGFPVEGGKYHIRLSSGSCVCRLYKARRPVALFHFEVPEGADHATKDFRLIGFRLAGTVTDTMGTSLPLTDVTLVPLSGEPSFELMRVTDIHGKFAIEGVPPGSYRLFFYDKDHASIQELRVEGDIPDSRFKIERGGNYQLSITDHDGNPLVIQYEPNDSQTSIVVDRLYNFWPPGQYSVKVYADGFQWKSLSFTIEEGKTTVVKATLDPE